SRSGEPCRRVSQDHGGDPAPYARREALSPGRRRSGPVLPYAETRSAPWRPAEEPEATPIASAGEPADGRKGTRGPAVRRTALEREGGRLGGLHPLRGF